MTEPTRVRSIDLRDALEYHSGVFDDVSTKQLDGWGASNFLVHARYEQPNRGNGFKIVAEWRSGSGSMYDRNYATHALRTWHLLAKEVLELRKKLEQKNEEV